MTQPAHPATPADHLNAINAAFAEQEAKLRAQIESSASELNRATQAAAEAQLDASALRQANERHALQLRQLQGELAAAQKALSEERLAEDQRVRSLVVRAVANSEANQAGLIKSLELEASQDRQSRERLLQESRERERQLGDEVSRLKSAIADQTHAHREKQADLEHRLLICNEQLTRLDEQAREHQRRRAELEVRLDAAAGERARLVELAAQNEASLSAQLAQAVAALHKQTHEHSATHQTLLEAYERTRQAQQARADDATAWLHAREAQHALVTQQLAEVQKDALRQIETVTAQQQSALQALQMESLDGRDRLALAAEQLQQELRQRISAEQAIQRQLRQSIEEFHSRWFWRLGRAFEFPSSPNLESAMTESPGEKVISKDDVDAESVNPSSKTHMNESLNIPSERLRVDQLLALNDAEFVHGAYINLLGRPADHTGFQAYLVQLRKGMEKEVLICSLIQSPEGKLAGSSNFPGAAELIKRVQHYRFRRCKKIIRHIFFIALRPLHDHIDAIQKSMTELTTRASLLDSRVAELSNSLEKRFDNIDRLISSPSNHAYAINPRNSPVTIEDLMIIAGTLRKERSHGQ